MTLQILLTGKNGQVGRELGTALTQLGNVTAFDRHQLDLSKPDEIRQAIRATRPGIIVNAAAYTAVDQAESDEATAQSINANAPRVMAEEAKKIGAVLVHYSTDYVFDGTKGAPYLEDDSPNPQNAYGRTKLAGEHAIRQVGGSHLIFRTAWVYAREGRNFLLAILRLATQREELRIVRDQIGSPTSSREIVAATTSILEQVCRHDHSPDSIPAVSGTYHMTAAGETSWYDFARAILEEASSRTPRGPWFAAATGQLPLITRRIISITTPEYPTPAPRPAYSVLSNARLLQTFGTELPDWRTQLKSTFVEDSSETSPKTNK